MSFIKKRKHSTSTSSGVPPPARSQRSRSVSPPSASDAPRTYGEISHVWTIAAAERHAQRMFDEMLAMTSGVHTQCAPLEATRRMSYSSTIKEMEVAYRSFVHATMEWKANPGVPSPGTEIPAQLRARRAAFTFLYHMVLSKLEAFDHNRSRDEGQRIIAYLLEDNLRRIIWQCVSTTANHMTEFAEAQKIHFMASGRAHMERLFQLSPSTTNQPL